MYYLIYIINFLYINYNIMSIFYNYSKLNEGNVYSTYLKIYDTFKDEIVNDDKLAQFFICDITPDYYHKNISFVDSDLMIQLGMSLRNFKFNNILLLLDESITKDVPLMLKNYNIHYYNSTNVDYYLKIIKKIETSYIKYDLFNNDNCFEIEF
jgi:hypothetical protein